MKYFLIAGEASGDLHGANLIKAIRGKDPAAEFRFWGGDKMKKEADGLLVHYKEVSIMGFVEVLMNLRSIYANINKCCAQIDEYRPDTVILIDYPGFNLRIAEHCKKQGIRVVYYIAPKVWAWKESRAKKLEQFVDDLIIIFPFEVDYFKKWNVRTHYVGNPLLDELNGFRPAVDFRRRNELDNRPVIALLPGSRKQEISRILPVMIEATKKYPNHQLVIAGAPGMNKLFYQPWLNERLSIVFDQTYDLLASSETAIVCSGTATLETALLNVPQVCGYIGNSISYLIAKQLVKLKYISLVNLCLDKPAITELIQTDMSIGRLQQELEAIMPGGASRQAMLDEYEALRKLLGGSGASERAAQIVVNK